MIVNVAMFFGPSHGATHYPCHSVWRTCMWKSRNCWNDCSIGTPNFRPPMSAYLHSEKWSTAMSSTDLNTV